MSSSPSTTTSPPTTGTSNPFRRLSLSRSTPNPSSNTSPPKPPTPSLFSNTHSRGPLYQYWRERNRESLSTRQARVLDAKERARGQNPVRPEGGPSSNSEYAGRLERGRMVPGTVGYVEREETTTQEGEEEEELPSYGDVYGTRDYEGGSTSPSPAAAGVPPHGVLGGALGDSESAEAEKARLQAHYESQQASPTENTGFATSTADDAAIAAALQADDNGLRAGRQADEAGDDDSGQNDSGSKGKEKERKKSVGSRVGNFLGTAFTGYNMKSDKAVGGRNANRW